MVDSTRLACTMLAPLMLGAMSLGSGAVAEQETDASWMAGVARVDITPVEPMWLAGYAGRDRPAEGAHHPLWAKGLALEDASGERAVLVTVDTLGFAKALSDRIRDRVEAEYGLDRARIVLSASHTHSGPVLEDLLECMYAYGDEEAQKIQRYTARLEDEIVELVGNALEALAPAELAAANGVARFAVNRRNNREADLRPTITPAGPSDHAVPVLTVRRDDGALDAVVFGYACHATVLSGYEWCGDYPGFAQIAVEETWPGATAMFFAGCAADQNPLPRRSVALARQYGQTLAAAVEQTVEDGMRSLAGELSVAYTEVVLQLEPPPSAETLRARIAESTGHRERCYESLLNRLEAEGELPTEYPVPLQMWRLGDQALVTLGGEVTVEYALRIKERLGEETFVMAYANDVMSYIPSETVLEEGGYEGDTSQLLYGMPNVWKPGLEARILDAVEALDRDTR